MNELTHEKSRVHARIVITALASYQSHWKEHERTHTGENRIRANTVKSALTSYQIMAT